MLSKRSNVFYLEHARVMQKDDRVIFFVDTGEEIQSAFGIPDKNTALLLLGKGTSITDAAVRKLAESNVMIGFCGTGGSPLFSVTDMVFLTPNDEYRPTEYAQAWVKGWMKDEVRLKVALFFLKQRITLAKERWEACGVTLPLTAVQDLLTYLEKDNLSSEEVLCAEGRWAKSLYASLSKKYDLPFKRLEGKKSKSTKSDLINGFIDHGNYIAYGYASAALHCLGIPFCFPVLHGKTRRGALVFDVADLIKDAFVMPLAFEYGGRLGLDQEYRRALITRFQESDVLDLLITLLKEGCKIMDKNQ